MFDKATTTVGVLLGGLSAERPVSLKTGKAVLEALTERGWNAVAIDVGRDLPAKLVAHGVDVAWIALHGRFGEDGCVQGLCEVMGIPYTGSGVQSSAVAMDKLATKRAVTGLGVRMAEHVEVHRGQPRPALPVPSVVKPAVGGSSFGTTVVTSEAALDAALSEALKYDAAALVEEFVEGDEITVAVVDGKALPVVRILPVDGWFDYEAKYTKGKTVYEVPAKLPEHTVAAAQRAAEVAYAAVGCSGLARADFLVPEEGDPVFLEINTLPGMTATSLSPMAAGATGVSFGELCEQILQGAHCMTPEG
ncbi:MAG: D-alanine--D-alanine ligase [Deltaproteobacteria bacterium]|nr:MAG: D-alanine--D-alanine ligase [Deltaproteobacteria bacterium]